MSLEIKIEMLGNPSAEFSISEHELHDLLSDDADGNAEYWHFQSPGLEKFIKTLARLYVVSNGGFTFQAIWSGNTTSKVENVSFDEFIEIVKCNRIGTKTKYVVVGGEARIL